VNTTADLPKSFPDVHHLPSILSAVVLEAAGAFGFVTREVTVFFAPLVFAGSEVVLPPDGC
jgi:hypothetical protein